MEKLIPADPHQFRQWIVNPKEEKFKLGDILANKETNQMGVIVNDYDGRLILECSSAPDTPFKRETKSLLYSDAERFYKKVGSIKNVGGYAASNEVDAEISKKTQHIPWVAFPKFQVGQVVAVNEKLGKWVIVAADSTGFRVVPRDVINSHEFFEPIRASISELSTDTGPTVKENDIIVDPSYGSGVVINASHYEDHGCVDAVFEEILPVKNYLIKKETTLSKAASTSTENLLINRCPTDMTWHTPFCAEHADTYQEPVKITASLSKVSFVEHVDGHKNSKGESAPWVVKQHGTGKILESFKSEEEAKEGLKRMETFKHKASMDSAMQKCLKIALSKLDFTDTTSMVKKAHSEFNKVYNPDAFSNIEVGSLVTRKGSQASGVVTGNNKKDNSVSVMWDNGVENKFWRSELCTKKSSLEDYFPSIVTPSMKKIVNSKIEDNYNALKLENDLDIGLEKESRLNILGELFDKHVYPAMKQSDLIFPKEHAFKRFLDWYKK